MVLAMDTLDAFEFLDKIIDIIKEENILKPPSSDKVVEYLNPQELKVSAN